MTDDRASGHAASDNEADARASEPPPAARPDWLLQHLLVFVNRGVFDFSVTLQVGGLLMSGQLVSGRAYMDGVATELRATDNGTFFAQLLTDVLDPVYPLRKENEAIELEPSELTPAYIHLRDCRAFHPSGTPVPTDRGVWWRGRLCDVSGFWLGALQVP